MNSKAQVKISYPEGFDTRSEIEAKQRGWMGYVDVMLPDGRNFTLEFYDPTRLCQDAESEFRRGITYHAGPNLIQIERVTTANIEQAVAAMFDDKYFDGLVVSVPK